MLFLIIYMICFLFLKLEEAQYDNVIKEKQRVEHALQEALEYTAEEYKNVIYGTLEEKKRVIETVFPKIFTVLLGNTEEDDWRLFLPVLVLVEEDGAVFYYVQESKEKGYSELNYVWSDKSHFTFTEESTNHAKRKEVMECLERETSKYITEHNYIAAQYGMEYTFFVPNFIQEEGPELKFPVIYAVFQGWPLNAAGNIIYENCLDAGAYLRERKRYVLEPPREIQNPVYRYHLETCTEYYSEDRVTKEEAIIQYGAVPCEVCLP